MRTRISSSFKGNALSNRLPLLPREIHSVSIVVTETEKEDSRFSAKANLRNIETSYVAVSEGNEKEEREKIMKWV